MNNIKTILVKRKALWCTLALLICMSVLVGLVSCSGSCNEAGNIDSSIEKEGISKLLAEEMPESYSGAESDAAEVHEPLAQDTSASGATEIAESAESSSQGASEGGNNNANSASAPSGNVDSGSHQQVSRKWVEDTERVWVVDKAAWIESIPIYDGRELCICNICGADITSNPSPHNKAHMLAGEGAGYHSEVHEVQVGTETINHPEEGHWETKVVGGHWE